MRTVMAVLLLALFPNAASAALDPRMPAHLSLTRATLADADVLDDPTPEAEIVRSADSGVAVRYVGTISLGVVIELASIGAGAAVAFSGAHTLSSPFRGFPAALGIIYVVGPTVTSVAAWALAGTDPDLRPSIVVSWLGGMAGSALALGIGVAAGDKGGAGTFVAALLLPPLGATLAANLLAERPGAPPPPPPDVEPHLALDRGEQPATPSMAAAPLLSLALP